MLIMQINTTLRYYFSIMKSARIKSLTIHSDGEVMRENRHSFIAGKNENTIFYREILKYLTNLHMHLSFHLAKKL